MAYIILHHITGHADIHIRYTYLMTLEVQKSISIKETCLCVVCRLFGSRFLSGHAALAASDTYACTIMTHMYDLFRSVRPHQCMSIYHVMYVGYATVTFKLPRKSECVSQIYVRRAVTHVHCMQWCKRSHLETQLRDLQRLLFLCKYNQVGIPTANHFETFAQ